MGGVAATIGALLTTWVTFVPCFVFIFLGATTSSGSATHPTSALSGITSTFGMSTWSAAVVGVIANLAFCFAVHALFDASLRHGGRSTLLVPDPDTIRPVVAVIAAAAGVMIYRAGAGRRLPAARREDTDR
ncbi:hypothetical protein MLGJGCBP_07073 [Rhodococcus sp. T7]|uniref:Putative membrane protein n=1 Tax=Rhodococcus opacus RKJ300 = JCM 13270 TaxID=1165867 RepID=I0WY21_RHOOP|nr:putative membrane protein [Rhodococcus opacus RKJ300 = JCM 13270]KAF0957088.1 hypothetical protein MLGJGCBP_08918 [Rhodococcus sp. T7]KAF0959834.1 hypothetical protein MLGJGCBP_07073 [Rhodococcus sp. T7]